MPQVPTGTSVDVFRSGAIASACVSPNTSLIKSCSCWLYPAGIQGLVNLGAVSLHAPSRWSSISHVFHFQHQLDETVTSCSDEADQNSCQCCWWRTELRVFRCANGSRVDEPCQQEFYRNPEAWMLIRATCRGSLAFVLPVATPPKAKCVLATSASRSQISSRLAL